MEGVAGLDFVCCGVQSEQVGLCGRFFGESFFGKRRLDRAATKGTVDAGRLHGRRSWCLQTLKAVYR